MSDREYILELVELLSELHVLYAEAKAKLDVIIPNADVNNVSKRFYGTELGEALRPLTNADIVLGDTHTLCMLYMTNAVDDATFMKEFSKISRARLSGVDIKTYIATVKVYLNAYKNPVNDIKPIIDVLSMKFMNPEIIPF